MARSNKNALAQKVETHAIDPSKKTPLIPVGPKTGTEMKLFLGLQWELEGYISGGPPRNTREYENMEVFELCRRIKDDMAELVARIHPTYREEWAKKFAPTWWRDYGIPHDKRCRNVGEKLAETLRPGLWQRLKSKDSSTLKKAEEELAGQLKKHNEEEPEHAANALAFVTNHAATRLENLSVRRPELMQKVAKSFKTWPVNLGVIRGKNGNHKITRLGFARKHLKQLDVNADCRLPTSEFSGAEPQSPFRLAAENLYCDLLLMKREPRWYFPKMTFWAKHLIALQEPMTPNNVDDWWKVAKAWLDEQWELNRDNAFAPLIEHLKHFRDDYKKLTPSLVKRQVVDDSLKKAFKSLAQPGHL